MPTLEAGDARARFARGRVARLATADAVGHPHIVPVVCAVEVDANGADRVLVAVDGKPKRHRDLKRLRNVAANPVVSLLVDRYDDDWSALWWVRADGVAEVDGTPATLDRARDLLGVRYPQHRAEPPEGPVIVITVRRWSGWAAT